MTRLILNLGLRLTIVCLVAAVGLGFTYSLVEQRIAEQERKQREEAGQKVLSSIGAIPEEDPELLASLQSVFPDLKGVFDGMDEAGVIIGYAFVVKSKGYNFITMAVGVDADGAVTGIEVVTNEETPGLGSVVAEDPGFLGEFNGKGPEPLMLGVDVDAVSGATFTSKGIADGVNLALEIWEYLREKR
jgi:Na+-translocating ferredoxin:NAD+ oxidoreductase subunit G